MTYSSQFPKTFLSLDRYANLLGFDPVQFFQGNTELRAGQVCTDYWYQFAWQNDQRVSREELRQAIRQSEEDLVAELSYFPAPDWFAERIDYNQFYQKEFRSVGGFRSGGFNHKTGNTKYKYVIQGGTRATSKIDAENVTREANIDTTGDGFDDTAVFTVTIDFTNKCELQSFFKEYAEGDTANCRTDPASEGADDYWQIRPIRTKLSGTTATVYIPIYLLFKPQLQRQIDASIIDADAVASYVDTVEFYRVYNDTSSQVTFLWTNESSCYNTACSYATQSGCMRVRDARRGIVSVAPDTYDSSTGYFTEGEFNQNREPDKMILQYQSGFRERNERNCDEISYWLAYTIAMLASARINKTICECESPARIISRWQEDMALITKVRSFGVNFADLSNPFGTKLGEVLAYKRISTRGKRVGKNINMY